MMNNFTRIYLRLHDMFFYFPGDLVNFQQPTCVLKKNLVENLCCFIDLLKGPMLLAELSWSTLKLNFATFSRLF